MNWFFKKLILVKNSWWYALIFVLPIQTRTLVRSWGIGFNEWNSAFLYVSDILLGGLFVLWLRRLILRGSILRFAFHFSANYFFAAFFILGAISLKNSSFTALGLWQLMHLAGMFFLFWYTSNALSNLSKFKKSLQILVASGLMQATLGIAQFFKEADLGLRFLGESPLDILSPNVAVFLSLSGERILRAYGTTPHPNVLAAFLMLTLFGLYWLFRHARGRLRLFYFILHIPLLIGFLLTFSRLIIGLWFLAVLFLFLRQLFIRQRTFSKYWRMFFLTLIAVSVLFIALMPAVLGRLDIYQGDALTLRAYYTGFTLSQPVGFFGVGIGNFVPWFKQNILNLAPHLYQPVHNIYLLLYAEAGILGALFFILWLGSLGYGYFKYKFRKSFSFYLWGLLLLAVLVVGFFDHFLITLQQGRLMLGLVLGIIMAFQKSGGKFS